MEYPNLLLTFAYPQISYGELLHSSKNRNSVHLSCRFISVLICRYMTGLYFLNDVEEGGETAFPLADNVTFNQKVVFIAGFVRLAVYLKFGGLSSKSMCKCSQGLYGTFLVWSCETLEEKGTCI